MMSTRLYEKSQKPVHTQWWPSYFVKVTELQLQLHCKKVTKLQLLFKQSNHLELQLRLINLIETTVACVAYSFVFTRPFSD